VHQGSEKEAEHWKRTVLPSYTPVQMNGVICFTEDPWALSGALNTNRTRSLTQWHWQLAARELESGSGAAAATVTQS
jgi:hypothetical protein